MNKTVSTFVPKDKTFSTTESLDIRIGVTGSVQILGYQSFLWQAFSLFHLFFDDNVAVFFERMDKSKEARSRDHTIRKKDSERSS